MATSFHSEEQQQDRDWAWGLPSAVIGIISEKLSLADFSCFRSVCKAWSLVLRNQNLYLPRAPQFPWLMVSIDETSAFNTDSRTFLSNPDNRCYRLSSPEFISKRVVGSSHGWLVLIDLHCQLSLLQPITGARLALPSITTIPYVEPICDPDSGSIKELIFYYDLERTRIQGAYTPEGAGFVFIRKIVLSCNPAEDYCIVVLIYGCDMQLAFARPDDNSWSLIEQSNQFCGIVDALFVDSHNMLAVTCNDELHEYDFGLPGRPQWKMMAMQKSPQATDFYIAVCDGKPLRVCRYWLATDGTEEADRVYENLRRLNLTHLCEQGERIYATLQNENKVRKFGSAFKVEKIEDSCWVETKNLNGYALFVGTNSSLSLHVKDVVGLKENCVYYTDDLWDYMFDEEGKQDLRDIGVFDICRNEYLETYPSGQSLTYPPPVWFLPSLH